MENFAYFQRQPFNAYSCHSEHDASCHMTYMSLFVIQMYSSHILHQCSRMRILRFFTFKKHDFLRFFEMMYQKVVKSC